MKPCCTSCKRLGQDQESQCQYDQPPKWLESVVRPSHQHPSPDLEHQRQNVIQLEQKLQALEQQLSELRLSASLAQDHHHHPHHHHQPESLQLIQSQPSYDPILPIESTHQLPLYPPVLAIEQSRESSAISAAATAPVIYHDLLEHAPQGLLIRTPDGRLASLGPDHPHLPLPWPSLDSSPCSSTSSHDSESHGDPPSLCHEPTSELREPGWPSHLPSRAICKVLLRAVFTRPLSPFSLLDPGSMLARLDHSAQDARFPDLGLLHALAAIGAQYSSAHQYRCLSRASPHGTAYWWSAGHRHKPGPGDYHAEWAGALLSLGLAQTGSVERLLEMAQGGMVLSQYFGVAGRPLLLWKWLGYSLRICCLLGVNEPEPEEWDLETVSLWNDHIGRLTTDDEHHRQQRLVFFFFFFFSPLRFKCHWLFFWWWLLLLLD